MQSFVDAVQVPFIDMDHPRDATVSQFFSRKRIKRIAFGALFVSALMLSICFATAKNNRTILETGLGGDWPAFYNAGRILNSYGADYLYDIQLQSGLYHQLLPDEPANASLPYANAPLIAMSLRPLAWLPYAWSYAAWIVASLILFTAALWIAWQAAGLPRKEWGFGLLLMLSFEPLAFESIHGGQISCIGLLSLCTAVYLHLQKRPLSAGAALAMCTYKPTLLVIVLPMLMMTRQWRVLAGFMIGSLAIAVFCVATIGVSPCLGYAHTLLYYSGQSTASASESMFRTWKFIDLNSFLKLLNIPPLAIGVMLVALAAMAVQQAKRIWPNDVNDDHEQLRLLWAAALSATLVLNLYVGIYDSVLVLPSLLLTAGVLLRRNGHVAPAFRVLAATIYLLPWFSQIMARDIGYQPFTLALVLLAVYQFHLAEPLETTTAGQLDRQVISEA